MKKMLILKLHNNKMHTMVEKQSAKLNAIYTQPLSLIAIGNSLPPY